MTGRGIRSTAKVIHASGWGKASLTPTTMMIIMNPPIYGDNFSEFTAFWYLSTPSFIDVSSLRSKRFFFPSVNSKSHM